MSKDMAEARAAKAKAVKAKQKAVSAEVQEILADSGVNDELKRKLKYCQDELTGNRPGADKSLLSDRRTELIREAKRRLRFTG